MSRFLSNLPPPLRSRFSCCSGAASGWQPLVPSSFPVVVPTSAIVVNLSSDEVGSLAPVPNHGHSVNEDPVTSVELLEPPP